MRTGRPRKPDAKRRKKTRAGRKPDAVLPTEEFMQRRLEAGSLSASSDHPLDLLFDLNNQDAERGVPEALRRGITEPQHRAGVKLVMLHHRLYGKPGYGIEKLYHRMGAIPLQSRPLTDDGDENERAERNKTDFAEAVAALRTLGSRTYNEVMNVAVYHRHQDHYRDPFVHPRGRRALSAVRLGLDRLAALWGLARPQRSAA